MTRKKWQRMIACMLAILLMIQMVDGNTFISRAENDHTVSENDGTISENDSAIEENTGTISENSLNINEVYSTSKSGTVSIQGTVRYENDSDWKALIRPVTFSGTIQMTALDANGNEIGTYQTTTDPGNAFYLKFVHDGNGGGSYEIVNVPVTVATDNGSVDVDSYRVSIPQGAGYLESVNTADGIAGQETLFAGVDLVRKPITGKIRVTKQVLGEGAESTASFEMKASVSANGKSAEKKVNVSAGKTVDISVPAGYTYTLKETGKEGYSLLYYEFTEGDDRSKITGSSCSIQVTDADGVYPVTVVNAACNQTKEWLVKWVDNHRFQGRPNPVFKLEFLVEGDSVYQPVEENLTLLGLSTVPTAEKKQTDLTEQDTERYYFTKLPSTTIDGKAVTYRVTVDWADETESNYLIEWNDDQSIVTFTNASVFSAVIKWSDASETDMRPNPDTVKSLLKLYYYTDEKYEEVILSEEEMTLSVEDEKNWKVTVNRALPQYTKDNESLTYVLVQGTIAEDGTVTQAPLNPYQTIYDNGTGSFANITDKCYNGQTIIEKLTGTTTFTATKEWKDGDGKERPAATVTLWRYSMKNEDDTEIDMSRCARVIVQGKTGDILMSYQLSTSNTGNNAADSTETIDFLKHFESSLQDGYEFPKYDELGRKYCYFVQETIEESASSRYNTTYWSDDTQTSIGTFDGGRIVNTKVDKLAIRVNKQWNAASALKDLEGKKITFALIGKDSKGNIEEIPLLEGSAQVSGFGKEQTTASTEFLINPYDEYGVLYEILGIQEKKIEGIEENSLTVDANDPTKVTFMIGDNRYIGTCSDPVVGTSARYDAKLYTYQVSNSIEKYKDYTIEKRWETGKGVMTQDLTFSLKAESIAPTAPFSKTYQVTFHKNEDHTVTLIVDGVEKSYTYSETESGDWTVWTTKITDVLPMYDDNGYLINYRAVENIPAEADRTWDYTNHSYTDSKTIVSNYVTKGESYSVYIEKVWNDDGDADHRLPVEVHVFDGNGTDVGQAILSQSNLWRSSIAVDKDPATVNYTIKEVKVGQYEVQEDSVTTDSCAYNIKYNGTRITNTRTGKMDVVITKTWLDGDNVSGTRPDSISFKIRGGSTEIPVTLTEADLVAGTTNQWKTVVTDLPKYDDNGKLLSYTVEEETSEAANSEDLYQQISAVTTYTEGNGTTKAVLRYSCTNRLQAQIDFTVYKRWNDLATEGKTRPDIYLTLHRIDTQSSTDLTYTDYNNQTWEPGSGAIDNYNWKITIEKLPAYNEAGYPYEYYVVETMNDDGSSNGVQYKTSYCKPAIGGGPDLDNPNALNRAYNGDYIVNTISDNMIIEGEKIWKNTQNFKVDDLPNPTIYLYRRLESEAEPEEALLTPDMAVASLSLDGQGQQSNEKNYGDTTKTKFIFTADKDGNPLPKYSLEGERYIYFLREDIPLNENVSLYTKEHKNNSLTNIFDVEKNSRSIYVTKYWNRSKVPSDLQEQEYPAVTLNLYRYIKPEDGTATLTADEKKADGILATKTINATDFEAAEKAGTTVTAAFEDVLIYSPNGSKYYYYIEEEPIKGYLTEYYISEDAAQGTESEGGIDIIDTMNLTTTDKTTKVSIKNTYQEYETIELTGTKIWDDYHDAFGYRPDTITVLLSRYTGSQAGQQNAITTVPVELLTDEEQGREQGKPYIVWTKTENPSGNDTWTYTIYNLRRYAPNGETYVYRLVEQQDDNGYYGTGNITINQNKQNTDGNITMNNCTNKFAASCYVRKNWIDGDNKYGFRPTSVTIVLQRSTDGITWENMPDPNQVDSDMQVVLTSQKAIPNTNNSSCQYTFLNLPKYKKLEGDEVTPLEYQYRCVETKIGTVSFTEAPDEETATIGSYTRTYTSQTKNNTVIANSMESTSLQVKKVWEDEENLYQTRPESLNFLLQKTTSQNPGENDWVNAKDAEGNDIVITMTADNSTDKSTWIKTFDSLPVSEEQDNQVMTLYYRAVEITEETADGKKNPKSGETVYKNYLVTEDGSTVNDASVWQYNIDAGRNESTITNKLIISESVNTVTVKKIWRNDNAGTPTYDVTFELQKKEGTGEFKSFDPAVEKTILKADEGNEVTFDNLPAINASGDEITYRVIEKTTDTRYSSSLSEPVVTDKKAVYTCTNVQLMNFTVNKNWENNQNGLKNGQQKFLSKGVLQQKIGDAGTWETVTDASGAKTFTLDDSTTKSVTFKNLPRYTQDGIRIYYRGIETQVNGVAVADATTGEPVAEPSKSYQVTYNHQDTHSDITNTLITVPIQITKIWDDNENAGEVRPTDIKLTLYADYDGSGSGAPVTVETSKYTLTWDKTDPDEWKASVTGLPRYAADGTTEIIYSLKEDTIKRYFAKIDSSVPVGENGEWEFTITNTLDLLITLQKSDIEDQSPLAGTVFMLYEAEYDSATDTYSRKTDVAGVSYTTDENGRIAIEIQKTGADELIEVTPTTGYELGSTPFDYFFTVEDADFRQTRTLTLDNERKTGTLVIYKQDGDTDRALNDVEFTLYKKNEGDNIWQNIWNFITGKKYTVFAVTGESTTDNKTIIEGLTWGEYKLVETATLEGYGLTKDDYFFTVKADNVSNPIELTSTADAASLQDGNIIKNYRNKIQFIKQSTQDVTLNGGVYRILKVTDAGKEEVSFDTAASDTSAAKNRLSANDTIYGLPVGDYEIEELSAPAGYQKNTVPVAFTIDQYGEIFKDKEKTTPWTDHQVIMKDEPIQLAIRKVDADKFDENNNHLQLTGAEFSVSGIFGSNGAKDNAATTINGLTVDTFTESLKGKLIASTGTTEGVDLFTYQIQETTAPEGYTYLTDLIYFTVTETGETKLVNPPKEVSLDENEEIPVIVVENTSDWCSFAVTKVFEKDEEWKNSIRPLQVTLQLYKQLEGSSDKIAVREPITFTISKDTDSYYYTYEDLPTHDYQKEDGSIIVKKLLYFVEETEVLPANLGAYYKTEYSQVSENGNALSQTITNTASELTPAGTLKISKTNVGGAQNATFRIQVKLTYNGQETIFKDTYDVYDKNDVLLLEDVQASDGYVNIKGGEYAKLVLPKGATYHLEEELIKLGDTVQYIPTYTAQDGTIIENQTIQAAIRNDANIYTAIENQTENDGNNYSEGSKPNNAGGIVGIGTGDDASEAYDKIEYQKGELAVFWKPEKDWQFKDSFTIVYREYDGSVGGGSDHTITVEGFLKEDGTPKDLSDSCYDNLKERYPNMRISQKEDGSVLLILSNIVDGMPYLSKVDVSFKPTIAVINTTEENAGGQVRVENGQFSDTADKRYPETKVYAKADKGYRIDLSKIEIGNVDTIDMPVTAESINMRAQALSDKKTLVLDKGKTFSIELPYTIAGREDQYTIKGKVTVLKKEMSGYPCEIAITLEELPIPVDIGVLFVKAPALPAPGSENEPEDGGPGEGTTGSNRNIPVMALPDLGKKDDVPKTGDGEDKE